MNLNKNFISFMQEMHKSRSAVRIFGFDMETGGLNDTRNEDGVPEGESGATHYAVLQAAAIIYDGHFKQLGEPIDIIIYNSKEELDKTVGEWSKDQFKDTLMIQCPQSEISIDEAEKLLIGKLEEFGVKNQKIEKGSTAIMLGNSIKLDMEFVSARMPVLHDYLHYRLLDVSTLKELFSIMFGNYAYVKKESTHDAYKDIEESVMELKYYLDNFIVSPESFFRNKVMKPVIQPFITKENKDKTEVMPPFVK